VRVATCALVLFSVVVGCSLGGDDGAALEPGDLSGLVLQPADLPPVFRRFDEGRQVMADSPGGSRADPERFGRRDGWKARYHRQGTPRTAGPIVVESRADLFDSSGGAEDDLEAARRDLEEGEVEWQPIDEPGLGDESFAATVVEGGAGSGVRHYHVYWRDANVMAFLNVNGFEQRLALEEVLELARKQERRIETASGGG
jgi:hypothetical protein